MTQWSKAPGLKFVILLVCLQFSGRQGLTHSQLETPFTKEVNPGLAKRPLKTNVRLANHGLTYEVKEATGGILQCMLVSRVSADVLVIKHQATSIHYTDWRPIAPDECHNKKWLIMKDLH